jgi:hypothetical protein
MISQKNTSLEGRQPGCFAVDFSTRRVNNNMTILDLLVWLIGFFVLGLFAARQTGRVGISALVGLVTGLIGGLMGRVLFVRDRLIDVHSS